MAQTIVTILIDDLTGKQLSDGAGETVDFALDGVRYEIDLDGTAAQKLRSTLETYVSAGRRMTKLGNPFAVPARPPIPRPFAPGPPPMASRCRPVGASLAVSCSSFTTLAIRVASN